jgi:nucleotide-binding universal stress UspA family protein
MFHRIVVAIDGSSTSKRALRAAFNLTDVHEAALCIVHVLDMGSPYPVDVPGEMERYEKTARKNAKGILTDAKALAQRAGLKADAHLLEVKAAGDRVADLVTRFARKWKADLIVVGTHGRRGVSRVFLGSVAESVSRLAPVPVLLVRGK